MTELFHTFTILLIVMLLRYFFLSMIFSWIVRNRSTRSPSPTQRKRDIRWSLLSTAIFAGSGTLLIFLWKQGSTKIYTNVSDYPLWYFPVGFGLYLFLQDTYFYWTHRWMHSYVFRSVHSAHHESRFPTAWTSFAFHPYEALIQALILPILVLLIPIHLVCLGIFLLTMSLFGVTNHLGYEIYPGNLAKKYSIITATHHDIHHKNFNYNYGLYFSWWDKWMGTEYP